MGVEVAFLRTNVGPPTNMPGELFDLKSLRKFAQNPFICHRSEEETEQIYTYGDIIKAANGLLQQLKEHNVPGHCGIALKVPEHSAASSTILLSILNHNCYFFPLDNDASAEMLHDDLCASGAEFLISKYYEPDLTVDQPCELPVLNELYYITRVRVDGQRRTEVPPSICYTIGTSGSTGASKMVFVPYSCIAPNVVALCNRLKVSSDDMIFLCAPLTFDPFVVEFFMALARGAALLIVPTQVRLAADDLLKKLFPGVTILQMTPSHFRMFGVDAIRERVFGKTSLRVLLLGGEAFPTPAEVCSWCPWKEDSTMRIFNIYGITEVSCWSTIYECTQESLNLAADQVPLGAVIDNETQLQIVNAKNVTLDGAGEGELFVGSATRICHIPQVDDAWSPTADAVLFRRTGDWVRREAGGDIYYLGRVDNTIKRLGKRICLDALSNRIDNLARPQLLSLKAQVVCCWLTHPRQLVCCLAPFTEESASRMDELKQAIKMLDFILMAHLKPHERPDHYECISRFPLNAHGKLNRRALYAELELLRKRATLPPLGIFKRFLSTLRVAPDSKLSFFAVGGTSFSALTLSNEIGELFSRKNDERSLLKLLLDESKTIAQICAFLESVALVSNRKRTGSPLNSLRKLQLLWRVDAGKCIDSSPSAFADTHICVGSHAHLLLCVAAATGCTVTRLTLPDRIECKVEYCHVTAAEEVSALALVGCYDGSLYAIDFLHGVVSWSVYVGGMIKAKPLLVGDDLAIVASYADDFNLAGVCLKSQSMRWRRRIGSKPVFAAPIAWSCESGTSIVVCALDGTCARLAAQCGSVQWQHMFSTPIFSTPALICDNSRLVVAEVQGHVHVCSTTSGRILCSYRMTEGTIFSSIVTTQMKNGEIVIYFGCHDQYMYCLKCIVPSGVKEAEDLSTTLELLWKVSLNAAIYSSALLLRPPNHYNPYIVACTIKGMISLLNAWTGHAVATYELPAAVYSTPCAALTDSRIYVGCRDNYLYCLNCNMEIDEVEAENKCSKIIEIA